MSFSFSKYLDHARQVARESWEWRKNSATPHPEGEAGLQVSDHRQMVGGLWEEIGSHQFRYMVQEGLRPEDVLCDVACGSFRAGRFFIPYLDRGHYLGIDKQPELIREGRSHEVPVEVWNDKVPEIVLSDKFEFNRFSKRPTKALAQSLFTHLSIRDIRRCMKRLYAHAAPGCVFYATFVEAERRIIYTLPSQSFRNFRYGRDQLIDLGGECGWAGEYIGDWGHPRPAMKMLRFSKRS